MFSRRSRGVLGDIAQEQKNSDARVTVFLFRA